MRPLHRILIRSSALCVAALCVSPLAARAEGLAVVPLVDGEGVTREQVQTMTRALIEEFETRPELEVREVPPPPSEERPRRKLKGGASIELNEGKRLAERLRIPQAIAKLERGLELFRAAPESVLAFDDVVEAHLLLAESHLRRGNESDGRRVLADLARIQPWHKLEEGRYPPLFVNLWDEILTEEVKKPRGALVIEGTGRVLINGKPLGSAPLRVDELTVGEHHVVVRGADGDWGETVSVRSSREVRVSGTASGRSRKVSSGGLVGELRSNRLSPKGRTDAVKAAAGARFVVFGIMARGEEVLDLALFLGDAQSGDVVRMDTLVLDTELLSTSIEANKAA
ncbi:MAG: PEGA domain-containing protein, partial [Myxococcota bacterium]